MPGTATSVAVVTQSVAAGLVTGLCLLQWFWWRNDRGRGGSGWLLTWTLALGALLGVNVALSVLPQGATFDAVLFVRAQVLAACVLLAVPTVRAFTGGPRAWPWVLAATAGFALRAVAWVSTGLVLAKVDGVSMARGPLALPLLLLPLTVVCVYVVLAVRAAGDRRTVTVIASSSAVSATLLVLPYVTPVGSWTNPLGIIWAVPVVAGLTALGLRRLAVVERETRLQHAMRDVLSEVGEAAWFADDPGRLLEQAERTARDRLADPSVTGSVRPHGGRFSVTFTCHAAGHGSARAQSFCEDLSRIVSVAIERIYLARDLREAALTDSLTALPNRRALERHLTEAIGRATEENSRLAVLHCDLDGFKVENELHGHAWGDDVLVRTAQHLRAQVDPSAMVARFGGDQFVVVVESPGSPAELVDVAHRLRTGRTTADADRPAPRMSVGLAMWCPESAGVGDHLLRQADAAMLQAKRTRSGVVVFDDALRARMQADVDLRRDLGVALVENEFTVHFQPVIDARSMAVVGVEALARWEHDGSTRMPGEWLPFAEETGLIVPIGRTVLRVAEARAAAMGYPVMVNVAARQLAEPSFVDQLVEDWGDGDWTTLTLEITESALLQDMPHVVGSLARLRELGARIAIDDFGTGYSSFARLATLPVDVLKIDRAFVDAITTDEGAAVVRAILSLAEAFRLDVVAEGVETVEQLDVLVGMGVPKLQGFLLGRPAAGRPAAVRVPRPVRSER